MKRYLPHAILLVVAVLAYGLLISQLGFYWDDLPISWIRYQLGSEALTEYFSTNRPVWGILYQITTSVIPHEPVYWQIFALFWRWLGAVVVFAIVEKLWKDKPRFAFGVALLFLVYPGFNQQWASFLYSHFFIVLFFFLYSYYCMLRAFEESKKFWRWTLLGILFSALNLWMMEYFYILELMRVGVILTALRGEAMSLHARAVKTFKLWLPYLIVFISAILSRLFIFNNQIYGISLGDQLKSAPLETMIELARNIRFTLVLVLRDAWMDAIQFPDPALIGSTTVSYFLVFGATILVALAGFLLLPRDTSQVAVSRLEDVLSRLPGEEHLRAADESSQTRRSPFGKGSESFTVFWLNFKRNLQEGAWGIGLGFFCVLMAGWPFWLIGFVPSLAWPSSRFTLPFMFGVSLIFAGTISLIPWERLRIVLLVSLISLAVGWQFLLANNYKQDWQTQKDLFWQLTWRAPSIAPDTAIIMNEGALEYYADNSLSPVVNWVYAPDEHDDHIEYVLLYPTTRLRSDALPKLEPDLPIFTDYLAGTFNGNTAQVLAVYFMPPACMRILDPEVDRVNRSIPEQSLMRFAARLTNYELISSELTSQMPKPYYPEPGHGWCYYFQKAELARQFGGWDEVVSLGEVAFGEGLQPADPAERFVFIEGYAHLEEWKRAVELSMQSFGELEFMSASLCQLWKRVEAETVEGPERSEALAEIRSLLTCNP